jgi:hypothetical protein
MSKTEDKIVVPVAARAIAIAGKHFAQGEAIKGVPQEEIDSCVRLGSVVEAGSDEGKAAILEGEQMAAAAAEAAAPAKK